MKIGMIDGHFVIPAISWMLEKLGPRPYGLYTKESLLEQTQAGHMQVWVYGSDEGDIRVVWVTQLVAYPAGTVLEVPLGAGHDLMTGLDAGLDKMCEFAREMGCKKVVVNGRLGWKRVLQKRGWSVQSIQMVNHLWS